MTCVGTWDGASWPDGPSDVVDKGSDGVVTEGSVIIAVGVNGTPCAPGGATSAGWDGAEIDGADNAREEITGDATGATGWPPTGDASPVMLGGAHDMSVET